MSNIIKSLTKSPDFGQELDPHPPKIIPDPETQKLIPATKPSQPTTVRLPPLLLKIMSKKEAYNVLLKELEWSETQITVGERADFCCEYCGKDLLGSPESYDQWNIDHIIPNGDESIDNLALACRLCNFIKRKTDPSKSAVSNDRESLINAAKSLINERRFKKINQYIKTLEAINLIRQKK